jgi:thioredoxin 1
MIEITESIINDLMSTNKPVVVDFYTTWCGPCRATAPKYKEWSEIHKDKAVFAKCDIEDAKDFAAQYNIGSIPTFIVFKGSKEVARFTGLPRENDLLEAIV